MLQPEGKALYKAARDGKLGEVRTAVDAGAPMEWANPGEGGRRAIHAASNERHKDVVAFLGSRGADVNAGDDNQYTPLHLAAYMGHASVCTTLLALGADPTVQNEYGQTALYWAREEKKTKCVALLLAANRRRERED
jgi:ankyrin repeat protein